MDNENSYWKRLFKKLSSYIIHCGFLNRWIVLFIDMFLATMAGLVSFTISAYLIDSYHYISNSKIQFSLMYISPYDLNTLKEQKISLNLN